MRLKNTLVVLASALRSLANVLLDTLLSRAASTLPLQPADYMQPEVINRLLSAHGQRPETQGATLVAAHDSGIQSVSSNCINTVLSVEWDEEGKRRGLPDSLFLKLPGKGLATKVFFNLIEVWRLECMFLRNFSHDFPVRLPRTYAVATRRSRFALLEENLHADSSVQLFTNPDMLQGPSQQVIHGCLATFARFHAFYNDLPAAERERRLPLHTHPFLSPAMSEISRVINVQAIKPCRQKTGELFPDETIALYRLAMQHWDKLLEWWYREPLTLIHGDSHLGNFFVSGDDMGMIDFQAAQWGKGIRDVQYFLIDSVPAETLAAQEEDLVRYYVQQLAENGMQLDFDAAWEQYRAYSFQTLMTIVVSIGLGQMTETETVMLEILKRSVAAIERLDFAGWLDKTIIHPTGVN